MRALRIPDLDISYFSLFEIRTNDPIPKVDLCVNAVTNFVTALSQSPSHEATWNRGHCRSRAAYGARGDRQDLGQKIKNPLRGLATCDNLATLARIPIPSRQKLHP